ncbi:hypothetical protein [Streptomyces nondiastaticus]|uniref:Uncharacterized protein n=1 Tax=Streptomyces nondiastaticus TaxID=3154512 RepID=A0ABW6U7B5_9ACTN
MTEPDEPADDVDVPRWMRVVSVTADVLLSLLQSGGWGGRSGDGGGGGGDDGGGD